MSSSSDDESLPLSNLSLTPLPTTRSLPLATSTTTSPQPSSTSTEHPQQPPALLPPTQQPESTTPQDPPNPEPIPPPTSPKLPQPKLSPSDFYFGRTLGEGAYARVVHARLKHPLPLNTNINNGDLNFAVKIMEKRHIRREDKVKYVMMEKRLLSRFVSEVILSLHLSFQDENYLYLCLDLCPGGELLHVIQSYRKSNSDLDIIDTACPLNVVQYYIAEIILALEYLHCRGIVHRDLKPENILLNASGSVKLGDFGTALDIDNFGGGEIPTKKQTKKTIDSEGNEVIAEVKNNSFVGTAEYVSPEVLNNEDATSSVDLWALGCCVYQLIVGRPPFKGGNEFNMFQNIMDHASGTSKLVFPETVQEIDGAVEVIEGLLLLDPKARIGATDDIKARAADTGEYVGKYISLRSHKFFIGFDWDLLELGEMTSPYIPPQCEWMDECGEDLIDGATNLDEYFLDGDATNIQVVNSVKASNSSNSNSTGSSPSNKNRQSMELNDRQSICAEKFRKHVPGITPLESILHVGKISKRKGFFSKNRTLILTDLPRLVYIDSNNEYKGSIPWSKENPVEVVKMKDNAKKFDVWSVNEETGEERFYHFTDLECEGGSNTCEAWVGKIQDALSQQRGV